MKKMLRSTALITTMILIFAAIPANAAQLEPAVALDNSSLVSVEYLSDGGYVETYVGEVSNGSKITTYAAATTKTGYKSKTGYDSAGVMTWKVTVYGTFSINPGVSVSCTDAWHTTNAYSPWVLDSASSSRGSASATGTAKFLKKFLFVTTNTETATVTVYCDKNGNIS